MTPFTRMILILTLILPIAGRALAQEATTNAETSTATATATTATTTESATTESAAAADSPDPTAPASPTLREQFVRVLGQHPREVTRILVLDPTLLSNEAFLARYPDLGDFIAKHPEVRRNPHYYLRDFETPVEWRAPTVFEETTEALSIAAVFFLIAVALAWFIRTLIEQKRWSRLSKTQAEVHNKILDRFGTTSELLEYIRTPAGTKFLESAPIPLREEKVTNPATAPMNRVMWSIQIGVIVAVGALGMLLVSLRFDGETAHGFFTLGMIGFSIGVGFIASALVSLKLSRRLGLWKSSDTGAEGNLTDSELVR